MAGNKKSVNLLPENLRTTKNTKFLSSTIDPLINSPELERIDGYIGSKLTPNYNPNTDFYLRTTSSLRKNYSLEPALIFKNNVNEINDIVAYDDLINELTNQGVDTSNLNNLFQSRYYSFDPFIDWDKFVNFSCYYWLPFGPPSILITEAAFDVETEILENTEYLMPNGYNLSNGMKIKFLDDVVPSSYANKEFIVEGVGSSIKLIDFSLLEGNQNLSVLYNETFDKDNFDNYPFDGDSKIPLTPEYITINRASIDLNSWSRYNRWFHKDVIEKSCIINNIPVNLDFKSKAVRPIIEFKPNLQLYNFGRKGIQNIDLFDTTTKNAFSTVDGSYGYYVDGIMLEPGHRVIFNADLDSTVKGKIYQVELDTSGDVPKITLVPAPDSTPNNLDSLSINYGNTCAGKSFYYNSTMGEWILAQQHTYLNQAPLFDLFDKDGTSFTGLDEKNNFNGSKIFGYATGTVLDPILGFKIKQENSVGIGSYSFKNYFTTETISKSIDGVGSNISTGVTFARLNYEDGSSILLNVWSNSGELFQLPIIENQVITDTSTTVTIKSIDNPVFSSANVFVNNVKKEVTFTTGSNVLSFVENVSLNPNDVVTIKITTDEIPNENGYYQTALSLTNNPLNGPIADLTFSELTDHLSTMVEKIPNFTGAFPGNSNLRDISDYGKYGTRLIINDNPIAFVDFFLGKKSHNVIDALRSIANHYNQFKMNLLKFAVDVTEQLTPADALEEILKSINKDKTINSPYYRSDMIGYGVNKTVRNITVVDSSETEYFIGTEFELTKLSFQSVLIYLNDELLTVGVDYSFNNLDQTVIISKALNENDIISVVNYKDTLGCFVPPTPTKLGLYPKFVPEIYSDTSYVSGPVNMIRGHDGSLIKAYNDYRDDIILEFEKRIFNNIKVSYSGIFDVKETEISAFRTNNFEDDINKILEKDFISWAGRFDIDYSKNSTFDETNQYTWNFIGSIDKLFGEPVSGTWKSVFKKFYDTEAPHLRPWEMLGFSIEPDWWVDEYGSAPYTATNTALWEDLRDGLVRDPVAPYILSQYQRPGLLSIIPVDNSGQLKNLTDFLVTDNTYYDKSQSWKFGDFSPAETAWRKSSFYPYFLNIAAALTRPCDYFSLMYDTSRIELNLLGQVIYNTDNLFLDIRKLVIDNELQTAGFSVLVCENGKQKYQNYLDILTQDLQFANFNLFHKLGGFTSKEKLQINIDSIDPVSRSPGVILPPEDYTLLLNVSNPVKQIGISGIIVQKSDGKFTIRGYDRYRPYFNVLTPNKSATSGALVVGGVSEEFSEWSGATDSASKNVSSIDLTTANSVTTRYYKQGQIVRYNNVYYRVKVSHTAQSTFNPILFQQLPSLPIKGGASAQLPVSYSRDVTLIPYGTEFDSIQDVFDVIMGYGAWLENQGFVFDFFNNDLNEVINWKFSAKEFLYWTTQNWSNNDLITLSPFSEYLKFESTDSVVDNIISNDYDYSLLQADGRLYPIDKFNFSREDGFCTIATLDDNEGLFFALLRTVQKEHGLVFNNSTIFNDTIYDIDTGYKQQRMKFSGFRTKNWNGDFISPGFVYNSVSILDWHPFKTYNPGEIVRYKSLYYQAIGKIESSNNFSFDQWTKLDSKPYSKLIPNFDYKISQFEDFYSLDVDNFDYEQQQLAQHLVGYTPRTYLNNIFSNPIAQYKFYQGFIKEKGTKKAIDKLSKVNFYNRQGSIEINEEWAFRIGSYGSYSSYNEIEFSLDEGIGLENPYITKFVDNVANNNDPSINYITSNSLLISPDNYSPSNTFKAYEGTFDDTNFELMTAGYVRSDDVSVTAYNKNSLLDIANNSLINNKDTVWLGFLENGGWDVYRYSKQSAKISGVYVSSPGIDITFVTDMPHGLSTGDVVSVARFNNQVNGVYVVKNVSKLNQFTVESTLSTILNEELLSLGILFKFESARVDTVDNIASKINLIDLQSGDKIWVDRDLDDKWKVYQKIDNYSSKDYNTLDFYGDQFFGFKIHASENSSIVVISSPGKKEPGDYSYGRITVFRKINNVLERQYEYGLNTATSIYCDPDSLTNFGYSIAHDENKKLFVVGAPTASKIRASLTVGTVLLSTGTGTIKTFNNEGIVKVSSKNILINQDETQFVLVHPNAIAPNTAENARFGHSVYVNQPSINTATTLLVSAPGNDDYSAPGSVFAYWINTVTDTISGVTTATVSANPYKFVVSSTSSISLNAGSQWGHKIAGDRSGEHIAISAPQYAFTDSDRVGIVQIFDKNLTWKQNISLPVNSYESFGHDITISDDGSLMLISSVEYITSKGAKGAVFLYKLSSSGIYELAQTLENPILDSGLKFGYSLSVSNNNSTIAISLLGTTKTKVMRFFEDLENSDNETTFDSKSTRFVSTVPDSGTVYLYDKIGNNYVLATELNNVDILEGSKYGISTVATNNTIFVGAPMYSGNIVNLNKVPDNSKVYQFNKIDSTNNGFKLLREQIPTIQVENIKRIALIDSLKEEIIDYLDVIDPLKGKISGLADQELKYKLALDPAIYSLGTPLTVVDTNTAWIDDHVGELWWDLSTAKFIWYEQGDDLYRKNNWGKLFPGSSIDVYEWVKSDLLPSEWASKADTNDGLIKGISGQPKHPDNTVLTIKQVYNNITNSLENVYYYWVKNKTIIPNSKNRRISSYQVASLIADPIAEGIKFAEILSADSIALANIQSSLISNRISANVVIDNLNNSIPHHTEWVLLQEGNKNDVPNTLLEKKLIDSLLGRDSFGNTVPDQSLSYRNRYGLSIRPQQTLFKDRIEALRNIIEFSNKVLLENRITDNYNFTNLNKKEEIPDVLSREYDLVVDTNTELSAIDTTNYKQAKLESVSVNGYVRVVNIIDPGFGYTNPPKVTIVSESGADSEIEVQIDNFGSVISATIKNAGYGYVDSPILVVRPHTVIITTDLTAGNRWTKNEFNYNFVSIDTRWIKSKTQSYNTTLYWDYVDWQSPEFNQYKNITYSTNDILEAIAISGINPNEYVKVKNSGNGYFIILEKVSDGQTGNFTAEYNIVYSEKGTIQINDKIWNYNIGKYSYDLLTLDETLYDQIPDQEINYILLALKEDIFVGTLKVNWNLLFFKAVKYAMSEQKLLDWAFKTSFITVKNIIGNLDQRPVYKLDSYQYFEQYIKEVKPYHTKIRDYLAAFQTIEQANTQVTDFDLPAYYENGEYKTINITTDIPKSIFTITNELTNVYPWKSWADYYTYEVKEVWVAEQGRGYTDIPNITISGPNTENGTTATAVAYLRNGGIYQIVVTNPGSGYVSQPLVTITGGGTGVTNTATASAILSNNTIRKNILGIKFDRISVDNEISNETIIDTFTCDGTTTDFTLSWLPEYKKENIVPKLDGKLVFATDYTLIFRGKRNKACIFKFLNYVPKQDQILKISYVKNIELFNAVERINYYYQPTETMPNEISSLMTGVTYGNNILQGLPFGYAVPWNTFNNLYGNFVWDELIQQYAFSKVITTAPVGTNTLYLSTVTDIVPGQVLNILSSSTNFIRTDTVVVSVSSATNSIVISNPSYNILTARSTGTNVGADIIVRTTIPFNGNLYVGDIVTLSGITPAGFNGQYLINRIDSNDTFIVTASSVLSTSTVVALASANAKVSSIITTIEQTSVLINRVVTTVTNTSTAIIQTLTRESNISRYDVKVNSSTITANSATSPYYVLSTDTNNRAIITVNVLSAPTSTIDIQLFTDPKIEFWKTNKLPHIVDTVLTGGSWSGTNFTGAFGVNPDIVNGEQFLSVNNNFGPEELVPGHTLDSIGINVYTKDKTTSPVIVTGAFPSSTNTIYTHTLTVDPDPSPFGLMVYSGDRIFNRVDNETFTDTNQYFIEGSNIKIPPQLEWARIGYTAMTLGGENLLDSRMIFVENTSSTIVESAASINDVNIAYVLVNGVRINEVTTTSNYGFMLTNVSSENNRACVKIYNMSTGSNNIQAWFFNSFFDTFSTFSEEYFTNVSAGSLTLSVPPANIKPESANAIVEVKTSTDDTRRRLSPPWVSYYVIQNNQLTFSIDSKNNRPSGYYAENEVRVYGNGTELRLNFDYTVNTANCTVTITNQLLQNGDAVAVMGLKDYDYIINNNTLTFSTSLVNADVKVITFTDHDDLLMHTEKFNPNAINRYTLSRPILNDNYVWVYKNGIPLIHRHDFEIMSDLRTVQFNEWIVTIDTDKILISTFAEPSINDEVLGFRVFKDIFDRLSYRRLSKYYSTFLTKELKSSDTEIHVDNTDSLITPDPRLNNPGVVIIDGERIEFFEKSGNILRQLRRSTLGTGPAKVSQPGTTVIDQSMHETIPYVENTYVQTIPSSNTNTYVISTATSILTGDGIILTNGVSAVDQIQVYYGGRQLRKTPLVVHDLTVSYNHTPASLKTLPPEFIVNTSTQEIILSLQQSITTGTDITIVQKKGSIWTGTESLLTSPVVQAEFLRYKNASLPDVYYYGGNKYMLDSSYYTIDDENGSSLEE
jgi:hypothetical protein